MVGAIGALVERYGLRQVHKLGHVSELLFTFGGAFLIEEIRENEVGVRPTSVTQAPDGRRVARG
jgi:branched-chain amino acid transport system permease protein